MLAETDGYVAVSVMTVDGLVLYEHDSRESMEAASIYKLPVMVEVFRQIEEGRLDPSASVQLVGGFYNEGPDSIGWDSVGSYYDLDTLLFAMVAQSSNVASYALLDLVGNDNVNRTMAELGLEGIEIRWSPRLRLPDEFFPGSDLDDDVYEVPVYEDEFLDEFEYEPDDEDVPADMPSDDDAEDAGRRFAAYMSLPASDISPTLRADAAFNVVTAGAIAELLAMIVNGQAVSPDASSRMLDLLYQQQIPGGLRMHLPAGVVAHKTGYLMDGVVNDAGVIQTAIGPVVAVVLTESVREDIAYRIMAEVGRLVYELGAGTD